MTTQIKTYLSYLETRGYAQTTCNKHRHSLKLFLAFLLSQSLERFPDVNGNHLTTYRHQLFSKGLKDSTIESYTCSIYHFFQYLEQQNLIFINPCTADFPHYARKPDNPIILTVNEVQKILTSIPQDSAINKRNFAMMSMLYATGIRKNELISLKLTSIDLDERTIKIMGKNQKEALLVLTEQSVQALNQYLDARATINKKQLSALWIDRKGNALQLGSVGNIIKSLKKISGINFCAHMIRRSMVSHLLANGMCPFMLSKHILRHDDITTLSHYLNTPLSTLIDTHNKLAENV